MKSAEQLGQWIAAHPIVILAAALLLTLASIQGAKQIEMQGMTTESMVGKDSPLYQLFDHLYAEKFATESIAIIVEAEDVTDPEILKAMDRFSQKLRGVPDVLAVTSIADIVTNTEMSQRGVRTIPSHDRISEILSLPANQPAVTGMMPDIKHTLISIDLPITLEESQLRSIYQETSEQVHMSEFPPDVVVTVTGTPALMQSITDEMAKSNGPILALAGLLMIVALLVSFNHVKWSLLPIPIVFLGIFWTFGAMGFLHIPFTMVSMSAFPVLIGIGIDYAIQFHNRIDEEFSKCRSPVQAVIETVGHVSLPVMIALIITAMGFVSLLTSSVPMTRDFGLLCLIGLFLCYLSALFVGVTLLYLMQRRRSSAMEPSAQDASAVVSDDTVIGTIIGHVSDFCIQRWRLVLALALFLSLAGIYADTLVQVDTDFKNYVPQDLPPLIDFRHMADVFGGTDVLDLIVQADDITNPDILKWMDDFCIYLKGSRDQVYGYDSIAATIKQANGGEIPDDKTAIRNIIDAIPATTLSRELDGHDTALIKLNVNKELTNLGAEGTDRLIKEIDKDIIWQEPPPGVSVRETGDAVVRTTVISALTTGRSEMTLLGLVLIFIVLLGIYRDLIKALLPVLPMLVVIGWMGGVMYIADMKYTPLTATLGALILGVGSEYAILMMERFYEELSRVGEPLEALKITARRIGSALIASGLTTVFGFAALISSPFLITNNFGSITVLAIVFALLTTFTVFVVLMYRMEIQREAVENAKYELMKALKLTARGG
jgi:hydrophobe/amphiphile efflux-3 (HAE3) family protein